MIISFLNQKGGVGKSTLTTNFACLAANEQKKTILFDMDPQRSAINFREIRPDNRKQFHAVSVLNPTLHKDITGFNFDIALIDSGGRDSKLFRSAIMASDIVVIPLLAGQFDIWSFEDTLDIIEEVKSIKDLKTGVVLNQVIRNTNIKNDAFQAIQEYSENYDFRLYETVLYSRVGYSEASACGLSVAEMEGKKFEKASAEIRSLYKEVFNGI